ncbi:hypothetical protein HN51_024664 [Arachis hypogaea]
MQVLTVIQKAGFELNLSICNFVIYTLVKGSKLEKALRFLIKGYCDLNRVKDALELIGKMPSKGCPPDMVNYYTVMAFHCKKKIIEEVKLPMEKMVVNSELISDQVTYDTLIHTLSKHGHADDALAYLKEVEDKGFHIDKVGHNAVVNSFSKNGKIDEIKSLVNEMYSKGCIPSVVTYIAIIDRFFCMGKIDEVKKMW